MIKTILWRVFTPAIPLFIAVAVQAANVHVGASATGNGSGSDWNNQAAWSSLSFTRGNVYYLADGSYGSKTLSTATSSTALITIKKAIGSDHGSSTGWTSTMGDGQAVISGATFITSAYWVLDGQTGGGPSSWDSGCGIKMTGGNIIMVQDGGGVNHITVQHVEFQGNGYNTGCEFAFNLLPFSSGSSFWTIRYCYFHNLSSAALECASISDLLWEYNYVADSPGYSNCHGEAIYVQDGHRHVYRYSRWRNVNGYSTGVIMLWGTGFKVYGNEIWDCDVSNGAIASWGGREIHDVEAYNNTIVHCTGVASCGISFNSDVQSNITIRDNLIVDCVNGGINGTAGQVDNNTVDNNTARFVNYAARDLRLTGPLPGVSLAAEFNKDLLNNTRGADGVWDRGTYEYGGTPTTPTPTPTPGTPTPTPTPTPSATPAQTPTATPVPGGSPIEAESGTISAPFVISGGSISQNVTTGITGSGRAAYSFTLADTGDYGIQAFVNGSSLTSNSFYLNIDAEPQDPAMEWDILPPTAGFENRLVSWRGSGTPDDNEFAPKIFHLTAGTHQVIIRGREADTQLDRFTIFKLPAPPQGLQVVPGP